MTMKIEEFLNQAWKTYSQITPDAAKIHDLMSSRGERIVNDHVAFRTFNAPGIGRLELGRIFEEWGYRRQEDLDFPAKKLKATYWLHERRDLPKIFISELLLECFDSDLRDWIGGILAGSRLTARIPGPEQLLEESWDPIRFEDYEHFYGISEYAAWTAAFGIRVNHFTISVNDLTTFQGLQSLNQFLLDAGFALNESGGAIKGTPNQGLEQSSTRAKKIPWDFAERKKHEVLSCYYEFALRHPLPGQNQLFQGFIPESADRIFESNFEKN